MNYLQYLLRTVDFIKKTKISIMFLGASYNYVQNMRKYNYLRYHTVNSIRINSINVLKERIIAFKERAKVEPCCFYLSMALNPQLMAKIPSFNRWDVVVETNKQLIQRISCHLSSEPKAARNMPFRPGFVTFTENRGRQNVNVNTHSHTLLLINPFCLERSSSKRRFDNEMIEAIKNSANAISVGKYQVNFQRHLNYDLQKLETLNDVYQAMNYSTKTAKFNDLDNEFAMITDTALEEFYENKTQPR